MTEAASSTTLTGVVLTKDGERLIGKCLDSLAFCDEILVVDSGSTDATLKIATAKGARVTERAWPGFADQFTFAAANVTTGWFFILDQDEICSPELAQAIIRSIRETGNNSCGASGKKTAVQNPEDLQSTAHQEEKYPSPPVAFSVARRSWYFDRFMKHGGWFPDHILRVFKTGFVTFSQDAHIHYHPIGESCHIAAGEIIHYPYTGFTHQLAKLNVYADQGAAALRASGKKGGIVRGLGHAAARFCRIYVFKAGFLDGRAGFLAAAHGSFYAFLKYVRVLDATWGDPFDHH